ncbi:hypothetical protein [Paraclostridium tenue]|uniref:Maltose/galactoside acetyltransferase domain-containing protein n=1 Tax=Paraclostridium tenue TaxID=1737 RepID=A0ABP3XDA2_9FIRM
MTEKEKMLSGKAYIASDEERVVLLKKVIWIYWRKYLYRTKF